MDGLVGQAAHDMPCPATLVHLEGLVRHYHGCSLAVLAKIMADCGQARRASAAFKIHRFHHGVHDRFDGGVYESFGNQEPQHLVTQVEQTVGIG